MIGSTSVMEETWTRNLLNVLTTPVTAADYVLGVAIFGLAKLTICLGTLTVTTIALYGFDMSAIGWSVIPIATLLVINGWGIAFVVIGLILRFGQSAEIMTWGLNYVVLALSGVFFPVEALPGFLAPLAAALPTTHLFAAARSVLDGEVFAWSEIWVATVATLVFVGLGLLFCGAMLRVFRSRGFVTRYS